MYGLKSLLPAFSNPDNVFDTGELVFMASLRKLFIKLNLLVWVINSMSTAEAFAQGRWQAQRVDTGASGRGLSVGGDVVWASGTGGVFVKTSDGGTTWLVGHVPGAEKLDFRDVEAFSGKGPYFLASGPGENSRPS